MPPTHCVHRWRIESPHGTPTLAGACKLCGKKRRFPASVDPFEGGSWASPGSRPLRDSPGYETRLARREGPAAAMGA